jgi:hypothetical protein
MTGNDFLDAVLAGNPLTAPFVIATKASEAFGGQGKKKEEQAAPKPPSGQAPPPPPTPPASTTPDLPAQQPVPPGGASGASLPALLEAIIKLQEQEAQRAREYYPEKARIDLETYRQQADIAERAGLEKMREKTARDLELQTIAAWQNITQAQLQRDTAMGLGMMNLAYQSGMPNSNILQASAALAQQGSASFAPVKSVI